MLGESEVGLLADIEVRKIKLSVLEIRELPMAGEAPGCANWTTGSLFPKIKGVPCKEIRQSGQLE